VCLRLCVSCVMCCIELCVLRMSRQLQRCGVVDNVEMNVEVANNVLYIGCILHNLFIISATQSPNPMRCAYRHLLQRCVYNINHFFNFFVTQTMRTQNSQGIQCLCIQLPLLPFTPSLNVHNKTVQTVKSSGKHALRRRWDNSLGRAVPVSRNF